MPALRSLYTITFLSACLAQAWAGPSPNTPQRRNQYGGGDQGYGGGNGGPGGQGQYQEWQNQSPGDIQRNKDEGQPGQGQVIVTITSTETMMMTVTAVSPDQKAQDVQTVTVTAVQACDSNVVTATAYVTTCPAAPMSMDSSSCMPCAGMVSVPANAGGLGNCPVMSTMIPGFTPGLSSIPAAQAVVTGVAAAAAGAAPAGGAPAAPAPTYGAPPPPADTAVTDLFDRVLATAAALSWGVGGSSDVLSSSSAGGCMPCMTGAWFTMTGSIVPGLSSIPNTMPLASAPVAATVSTPTVPGGVFASNAAPLESSQTTTTTSAAATTTQPSEKEVASSISPGTTPSKTSNTSDTTPPSTSIASTTVAAAAVSALSIQSAVSYGNSGLLGLGRRFVIPRPTALS